ncbi:NAD(P)-dependent alcohol dehydrogenase [Nocardiopsis aegyptia]|uniref:NAD(P)-dependent alcohol dehydrogenase n=1 Tax=Nocardiopsis aegyptia TaxID=220378 RepID=UPI00366B91DE
MKAFVRHRYGSPEVLDLVDTGTPVPRADEVLVQVRATSVNPYDWHHMRGEPRVARLMGGDMGLRRPVFEILGADVAGRVEAVGADVTRFRPGDEVYAMVARGAFAEYVCVREDDLAPKPGNLSFAQAAAVPMAALTALLALRDHGRIASGHRVLVNGASGGVGTFAVQLARAMGGRVTGVCGTGRTDLVRSLGAEEAVDYTTTDFTRRGRRHDLLLDGAGGHSGAASRRALTPRGAHVVIGGPAGRWLQPAGHMLAMLAAGPFVSQRIATVDVVGGAERGPDLRTLTGFIESGDVVPVIGRSYPFEDIPAAIGYQERGRVPGKVVIEV